MSLRNRGGCMLLTIVCDLFDSRLLILLKQSASVARKHVISSF